MPVLYCYDDKGNRVQVTWNGSTRTDTKYYYVKDHLGSIKMTLGAGGSIAAARDYYPFGETLREYQSGVTDRFKFTEKERDNETNYDYFGARYYDSELGRWMTVDPLSEEFPEWTPYNYCYNNPLGHIDYDGTQGYPIRSIWLPEVKVVGQLIREYDVELRRMALEFGTRENFILGCTLLGATIGGTGGFGVSVMGGPAIGFSPAFTAVGAVGGGISGLMIGVSIADLLHLYSNNIEPMKNAPKKGSNGTDGRSVNHEKQTKDAKWVYKQLEKMGVDMGKNARKIHDYFQYLNEGKGLSGKRLLDEMIKEFVK